MSTSFFEQAVKHHGSGDLDKAESLYRKAIKSNDQQDSAAYNLALLYAQSNRADAAQPVLRELIDRNPDDGASQAMLGKILLDQGDYSGARKYLEQAVKLEPTNLNAALSLAETLISEAVYPEAISLLEKCLKTSGIDSASRSILKHKMGEAFTIWGDQDYDIDLYEKAKAAYLQDPPERINFLPTLINLSRVHAKLGEFDEAATIAEKAVSMAPQEVVAWMTKASALSGLSEAREYQAIDAYRRVLEMEPEHASAHWNLSQSLLRTEQYEEGWIEYRWRTEREHDDFEIPEGPVWHGEVMDGPLVIYTEQGYGDAVQFARFIPAASKRVGSVTISCQPRLMDLFDRMEGDHRVCARDDELDSSTPKVSIMDLPDVLSIGSEGMVTDVPYIMARENTSDKFSFLRDLSRPRIGIVWAGNPYPDPLRTCPLEHFVGLSQAQGIQLQSLLVGPESEEITENISEYINDLSHLQDNFDDAASLIQDLDLVITVDTAIAHLAAAMAKETWMLLPFRPEWRWPLSGDNTPWYPSMRLFRQKAFNDWSGLFSEVNAQLTEWRS